MLDDWHWATMVSGVTLREWLCRETKTLVRTWVRWWWWRWCWSGACQGLVDADTENTPCRLSISEQAAVESEATEEEAGPPNEDHLCPRCASQLAATLTYDLLL